MAHSVLQNPLPVRNASAHVDPQQLQIIATQQTRLILVTQQLCSVSLPELNAQMDRKAAEHAQVELAHVCMDVFDILNVLTDAIGEQDENVPLFEPVEEGSLQWMSLILKHMRTTIWQAYQDLDEEMEQLVFWRTWSGLSRFQGCLLHAVVFLDEELESITEEKTPLADIRQTLADEAQEARRAYKWFEHQITRATRHGVETMAEDDVQRCLLVIQRVMGVLSEQPCFAWMYAEDRVRYLFLRKRLIRYAGSSDVESARVVIGEVQRYAKRLLKVERREIFELS